MTRPISHHARVGLAVAGIALAGAGAGYGLAKLGSGASVADATEPGRKVLYWYDPMAPSQHFDKPGKSPFMDMQLVPRYADQAGDETGIRIDPARVQNLGIRAIAAQRGMLTSGLSATGTIDFNQRDLAVVQARSAGFVQRVYARAPGDVIGSGAPLADLLVPEWAGAQAEFLAVRRTGNAPLTRAARQRLALLGMPAATIAGVERSGRPRNVVTVTAPSGGTIRTLGVRTGMSVTAGQTLAEINGLGTVWLNAAVPEAMAARLHVGQRATATLAAMPNEQFAGRVSAILPDVKAESRTITARIELPNPGGRLRPGMFASIDFGGTSRAALLVPSEAIIRTGKRTLVMLALPGGRYQPAEVRIGSSANGQTDVVAGLAEGEKVVASGQFLIDSEASLVGMQARPISAATEKPAAAAYQASGRIDRIGVAGIRLSHGSVAALGWPAMTMTFRLASPALVRGYKAGDRVRFAFDQTAQGPIVRQIDRESAK